MSNEVGPVPAEDVARVVSSLRELARKNRDMENEGARLAADHYRDAANYVERELLLDDLDDLYPFVGYCLECGAKHEIGADLDPEERGCMCGGYVLPDPTDGEGVPV